MVKRYTDRPLITPKDIRPIDDRLTVVGAFNPGVTTYNDKILLLIRVAVKVKNDGNLIKVPVCENGQIKVLSFDKAEADYSDSRFIIHKGRKFLTSMSYLVAALSDDGENFDVDYKKILLPDGDLEEYGIEDPRITKLDGYYYVTYSAVSNYGICTVMKRTKNFSDYERIGAILYPDNKDAVLFPEKINGKYYLAHRPSYSEFGLPEMWVAESDNLTCWGNHKHVMSVNRGEWDGTRLGSSGVPYKTDEGWLLVYHGVDNENRYSLGAVLLDKEQPWKVLARTRQPFLTPETVYEKQGFFPNTVFSCGSIVDKGIMKIYYGASDKYVCGCEISVKKLLEACVYEE